MESIKPYNQCSPCSQNSPQIRLFVLQGLLAAYRDYVVILGVGRADCFEYSIFNLKSHHFRVYLGLAISFFNEKNKPVGAELLKLMKASNQDIPDWFEKMVHNLRMSKGPSNSKSNNPFNKSYNSHHNRDDNRGGYGGVGGGNSGYSNNRNDRREDKSDYSMHHPYFSNNGGGTFAKLVYFVQNKDKSNVNELGGKLHFIKFRADDNHYPYLLVNIGSGVSIIKVENEISFQRVDGTSLGGDTFWGLCSLLTGVSDYDEMLEMTKNGQSNHVDLVVDWLSSDTIASSFGKVIYENEKKKISGEENIKKEDMAQSLLKMVSNNIGQIAYLNSQHVMV
ncbi:hypothetical protein ACTFIW_001504 [Dictyostelium discoideum]